MPYIGNQHVAGDHVNNFKVLDDISTYTATFDGSSTNDVSAADDTIRVPDHRFIQGQRVTYNNGGGSNIGGLTSGTAYYVSFHTSNTIKLATSLINANSNSVINISAVGSGSSHTLNAAFDGVNTKFKLTHSSGKSARLNNATQINVAINNVIQRPNNSAVTFTEGFALEDNHKIAFKTAPTVNDIFWGSIIANTIENFDLQNNEIDNFTGDGSTTEFTLTTLPANNDNVVVSIDGVLQHPSDASTTRAYTLIANIIQFTAAPALNAEIQVRHIGFAGASTNDVSGFYGRTGNVALTANDHITTGDITARNLKATGITTFSGSVSTGAITATTGTFSGNVSIGGTLTYEDVTNIDSVGLITARDGIFLPDGKIAKFGNTSGSADLNIYHSGSHSYIENSTNFLFIHSNSLALRSLSQETFVDCSLNGSVDLYHDNLKKFETSEKGIQVGSGVTIETNGQATFVGIVTFGSGSTTIDDNVVNVGTALTLGHTQGLQFHTQNLHSAGFEVNQINASGIITASSFRGASGGTATFQDIDVDGHTNLDNVSVAGVTTFANNISLGDNDRILFGGSGINDAHVRFDGNHLQWGVASGQFRVSANTSSFVNYAGTQTLATINSTGLSIPLDLDVDGHTNLDNVSIAGITTFSGQGIRIANATNPFIHLKDTTNNTDSYVSTDDGGSLYLKADDNQEGSSTKIVFQVDGSEKIHVTSGGAVSWKSGTTPISGTGNNYSLNIYRDSGGGYGYFDVVTGGSNHTGVILRAYHNGTYNHVFEHTTSDYTRFYTGGNERLRIAANGQITTRGAQGTSFNNAGTGDFGSFLTVNGGHTANQWGILSLEGNTSASGYSVGQIQFINQDNANGSSGANVQSRMLARIEAYTVTSDSNAGDDSGGALRFFTKPEADQPTERLRINHDGEIYMGANMGATNRSTLLSISGANQDPAGVWTQVGIYADGGQAVNKGGSIGFGGPDGTNSQQQFSAIKGAKENSTSGNYAGYMAFYTRPAGSVSGERLRITSTGNLKIPDNLKIELGGSQSGSGDFYLNFDGTYATMHSGGNQMNIRSNRIQLGDNGGVLYIDCTDNSTVKLYHQSGGVASEKLSTASFGIDIPDTLRLSNGYADTGSQMCLGADSSGNCSIAGYNLKIATGNNSARVDRFLFSHSAFYPAVDNTYDLGMYNYRWKDLYVGDAHFSNRDSKNEVDGTWGDWTLQEGESKIFMINNRTGKKYSLVMEEE